MHTSTKSKVPEIVTKTELMASDVAVRVLNPDLKPEDIIKRDIRSVLSKMQDFQDRFSRFRDDNELHDFNSSSGSLIVSEDLFNILKLSLHFFDISGGLFDVGILPVLVGEGYQKSKEKGFVDFSVTSSGNSEFVSIGRLKILDPSRRIVLKPDNLMVDLGGIGKGYIVDKVSDELSQKYEHFAISVGGDVFVRNMEAAPILKEVFENVSHRDISELHGFVDISFSNGGVAVSATKSREWKHNDSIKHHIIDPRSRRSLKNDLSTSVVLSDSAVSADVLAKIVLMNGSVEGVEFANSNNIPCFLVNLDKKVSASSEMRKYLL
jgi:thiamine biosynthesis lipoprotein